jgi:ABC-type transporter Mla subunit MlaD
LLAGPVRSLLRGSPLHEADEVEQELHDAVEAIHRAAESMERHVEVVDSLASSVPALTDSVNALVNELNGLLGVLAPLAAAEREVTRVERLFGRRRAQPAVAAEAPADPEPPVDG